jgi:predicted signal transduction protein with EAL and GGDEF domain
VVVVLVRIHTVGLAGSQVLAAAWTAMVALVLWSLHGSSLVGAVSLFFVPVVVFAALFLAARYWVGLVVADTIVLWMVLATGTGVLRALAPAVLGCVALSIAGAAVQVLTRSARRHDTVDPDTGLPNGFGLARQISERDLTVFVVAAVVLDGIATAREALGYQVGTELLRRAVEDLGQVVPSSAVIGRVDGDELVLVLPLDGPAPAAALDGAAPDGAAPVPTDAAAAGAGLADTLVRAIGAGRYLVGEIEVTLRAHVGVAIAPWDGHDVAQLVRRASLSARRAADTGVGLAVWDGDRGALTPDDLALLGRLRLAAERGELSLSFQPQVSPATGSATSVEALLRWTGGSGGTVSPGRFIPLAERTGLIDRLTEWVVVEALDAQQRWRAAGIDLPVSVNVSAKNLADPELAQWILTQLHQRQLPAGCLTVEVTETAVAEMAQAETVLGPLHRAGIRISIDDFGTGYTSLAVLPTLPVDELKVDQCFVMKSIASPADAAIVRTIGELAHRLGLHSVAEGVESAEVGRRLHEMGFDLLQGYHFAPPMPEADLLAYLSGNDGSAVDSAAVVPTTVGVPEPEDAPPHLVP